MLIDELFEGTKRYHAQFTEICKPLVDYIGITHAMYIDVDQHRP